MILDIITNYRVMIVISMAVELQRERKEDEVRKLFYMYVVVVLIYQRIRNYVTACTKNSSASSINTALRHYLGAKNFRHEINTITVPLVLIKEIRYVIYSRTCVIWTPWH